MHVGDPRGEGRHPQASAAHDRRVAMGTAAPVQATELKLGWHHPPQTQQTVPTRQLTLMAPGKGFGKLSPKWGAGRDLKGEAQATRGNSLQAQNSPSRFKDCASGITSTPHTTLKTEAYDKGGRYVATGECWAFSGKPATECTDPELRCCVLESYIMLISNVTSILKKQIVADWMQNKYENPAIFS